MLALCSAFFALALPAQIPAPAPPPQWLTDIQKVQQEMHRAPLGSLDAKVEQAWRAALAAPLHPQFRTAAMMTAQFYQSQGYELKAEQVLREAVAATAGDPESERALMSQLAAHFQSAQQPLKAVAIREKLAKSTPAGYEVAILAHLYEAMGEVEKAEALWKEIAERPAAGGPPAGSPRAGNRLPAARMFTGSFSHGYRGGVQNELASFYARHGRTVEAEQLYKKALAGAAQSSSPLEWNSAADGYIAFLSQQRRFDEAVDLARRSIARQEVSPEPHGAQMLFSRMQQLAALLNQAGRPAEALAVHNQMVEAALARGPASPEYTQALGSLAQVLIEQNRLEEAEKTVVRMREAGAGDAHNARLGESMAAQLLARIRDMQKKPEEARRLRESVGVPGPGAANRERTVYEMIAPAQQAAFQGDIDGAMAGARQAMALAAERSLTNPQEVAAVVGLASVLMGRQKEREAKEIAVEALRILEQAPDHPRVAEALGSIAPLLARLGMTAEAERAIGRQEKILIAAKGAESPALKSVSHARIELMQREQNWTGVVEEHKRALALTEKASGPKSRESMYALRDVAFAYPQLNNWAEEERVLANLLERTVNVSGRSSVDHAHLLVHMANRASQNREFDKALGWIDQAIEVAGTLPDARVHVPGMVQNREQIAQAKNAPPGGSRGGGKWFDTDTYYVEKADGTVQRTDGTRLGIPAGRVVSGPRPAVSAPPPPPEPKK